MGSGSVAEQMLRFARNMILARLLAPMAFGTMAIALSSASLVDTLMNIGVGTAVIQNPRGGERRYLNAGWWLSLARGLFIYAVIFTVAPWVSRFYGNPQLSILLRVILLSVLFQGAMSAGTNFAIREMKFSKWAVINHGGAICGVVLTVILSFFIRDVWALAIGYCAENVGRCTLSYLICPFLPSFSWDKEATRDLLRFSKGVFGLAFLNFIFSRTDIFVLAKLYPATQLGLYVMAVNLVQTPVSFIMDIQGQTLLPALSQVQGENGRVNRIFFQVASVLLLLGIPVLVFASFCGHSVLTIVYGQRYAPAAACFIVAAFVALFNLANGQPTLVFFAKGFPHLHRTCVIITATSMVLLIYPFTKWLGLVGGQVASLVAILLGFLFQMVRLHRLTDLNLVQYGKILLQASGISLAVALICLGARSYSVLDRPIPNVSIGIAACLFAYGISGWMLMRGNLKGLAPEIIRNP